jgi:hypothetical protein
MVFGNIQITILTDGYSVTVNNKYYSSNSLEKVIEFISNNTK